MRGSCGRRTTRTARTSRPASSSSPSSRPTTPPRCRPRRRPCRARASPRIATASRPCRYQGLFKTGMVSQQDLDNVIASVADADGQVQAAEAQLQQREPEPLVHADALADRRARRARRRARRQPRGTGRPDAPDHGLAGGPGARELSGERGRLHSKPRSLQEARGAQTSRGPRSSFRGSTSGGTAEGGDPGIDLVLSDGSVYPHKGVIVAVNRQIDPSTGTIQLQALVPNPDETLRPGQFGRVRIPRQDAGKDVIAVPEKALINVQGSYSVGVVGPDNKVQLRKVDLGPSVKGLRIVEKGLAEGDRIVVDGVQRITDGAVVDPRPAPDTPGAPKLSDAGGLHVGIFHPKADRGDGHRDHHGHRRRRLAARAPDRPVSADPAAAGQPDDHVHGRRRAHDRAVGRDADRAADERRRPDALHPVDERERRLDEPGGDVRRRDRSGHRQRPRQQPLLAGAAVPAAGRQELRRHDQEVAGVPAHGHLALLARRPIRRVVSDQLREHQRQRRAPPREGRRRHPQPRIERLRDARMAQSELAREQGVDRHGRPERRPRPERREPGRPDRRGARACSDSSSRTPSGRRAAWSRPRSSRTSSCARTRTGPPCGSRTSAAPSSGRSTTSRTARSTASRAPSSPRSRRRDRTRSTSPSDINKTMADLATKFPAGIDYKLSLDTTRPGEGGYPRDRRDAPRGHLPRRARRLRVSPELARDAHPAPDRAGLARRRLRGLPAARLLGQHALALRARPRDRSRRRRRDRRRRGRRAPHRGGHGAARRGLQGHVRSVRPGRRDRPHPGGRVHSGRVHGRSHGSPLSAVCAHDRLLGAHLGVQRAHAQPRARRDAAAPAQASRKGRSLASDADSIAGSARRPTATSR